jgi:hypothetical protein
MVGIHIIMAEGIIHDHNHIHTDPIKMWRGVLNTHHVIIMIGSTTLSIDN